MDLFNKTFAHLSDWYRSLTPGARITAALLLAVCAASVAFLCNQQLSEKETYLFGGEPVPTSQWPAMLQAFANSGLTDYEIVGSRIRVPSSRQAVYMGALANAGALPNNFGDSLRKMLDKSSSPWIGKRQQEEMSKIALQEELTKIINSMPGIESASVLYNVQTEEGLNPKRLITASVNVKPAGRQLLSLRQVDMIRQAVGPPIGVDPQSVAIVDFNGATYPASAPAGGAANSGIDRFLNAKLEYEQQYAERIRDALSSVAGAAVTVNVELNPALAEPDDSVRIKPRSSGGDAAASRSAASETPSNGDQTQSGIASSSNQPAIIKNIVEAVVGVPKTKNETASAPGRSLGNASQQTSKAGLTPKRITVSIGIPSSYYEQVWRQRHPGSDDRTAPKPDAEALRQIEAEVGVNIKQQVLQVVPWPEDAKHDRAQWITVTTFQNISTADNEQRVAADETATWLSEHGITLGLGLAALVSLLALRWLVRSASQANAMAPQLRIADEMSNETDDEKTSNREAVGRFRGSQGLSLREELATIVHDDPDVAASVLRNWIGSAG